MKVKFLLVWIFLIVYLISFVSAASFLDDWAKNHPKSTENLKEIRDLSAKLFGFKSADAGDTIFGFKILDTFSFKYLLIGWFAGLLMWGVSLLSKLNKRIKERITQRSNPFVEFSGFYWLNTVSGALWKVVLVGVGYFVIMQIPLISRLFYFITFEFLFGRSLWLFLIIAFELGFLPQFLEKLWVASLEAKYERGVRKVVKASKTVDSLESNYEKGVQKDVKASKKV